MGVLILVGEGKEDPSVVKELLNVEENPGRPMYSMAPPEPLVLFDTLYDDVQWIYSSADVERVGRSLKQLWEQSVLKMSVIQDMLAGLDSVCVTMPSPEVPQYLTLGKNVEIRSGNGGYVPIMDRKVGESLETRLATRETRIKRKAESPNTSDHRKHFSTRD